MRTKIRDFRHPYEPYDIQIELMNAIYDCIAEAKIGIFESPTGTGKSLSLICSSLAWLRDMQDEVLQSQLAVEEEFDEPTWVVEQSRQQRLDFLVEQRLALEAKFERLRAREFMQKKTHKTFQPESKHVKVDDNVIAIDSEETQFELDDYDSDDESKKVKASVSRPSEQGISSANKLLMERLGLAPQAPSNEESSLPTDELKIYFCSRTHSQLTQFVQEVRRVDLRSPSWVVKNASSSPDGSGKPLIKHVPLGSRRNLCINPKVSKLSSLPAINERCLELQQSNTPKDHRCPFVPTKENETLVSEFRDHTIAKVRDIEDLGALGKELGVCPYYASRATIKPAEIVTLPYPLLLQKSAREALGISLKGNVVIIDEAHNLMDTISNIQSNSITIFQLKRCRSQLRDYLQKFRNKLKGKNRMYVAQVVRLVDSVASYLETVAGSKQSSQGIVEVGALLAGKGVDQINLYKLMHYLQESKLAQKVESYAIYTEQQALRDGFNRDAKYYAPTMPVLTHVQSFFQTLTNPAGEGRFFYEKVDLNDVSLKYMLLDPTNHFKDIVEDTRAVILVGGTMSPMEDYIRQLFAYVEPPRLKTFSCGHIIPQENLIALPVIQGHGGKEFDFTYEKRNTTAMMDMLGHYIFGLSSIVPDGLVVFFSSYAYLDQVVDNWQAKPTKPAKNIWDRLQASKPIFREEKSSSVDDLLIQYAQAISKGKGGLLLSVIGGKLSEGINFSDALGRGVVVVGLPFPNIQSAQWKAKLEYLEQATMKRTGKQEDGKAAARDFYENACMRAVNQSIGRAIRHKADYASILLLDKRYASQRIQGKLPGWIRQGIKAGIHGEDCQDAFRKLKLFFKSKEEFDT